MTNPSVLQIFTEDRFYQSLSHECTNIFHQYVSSILKIIRKVELLNVFFKRYKDNSQRGRKMFVLISQTLTMDSYY